MVVRMIVWTCAVSSWDAAIQYRRGIGTDTTHCRVGTQGMTHATRWAAVWAIRRPRTRRTKPAPLATEGQQQLFLARVTAQPQKAMDQDATLQVVVKFTLDIGRQTCGIGVGVEHGEKGFEMVRNHFIEHRAA